MRTYAVRAFYADIKARVLIVDATKRGCAHVCSYALPTEMRVKSYVCTGKVRRRVYGCVRPSSVSQMRAWHPRIHPVIISVQNARVNHA